MPILSNILSSAGSQLVGGLVDNFILDPLQQRKTNKIFEQQAGVLNKILQTSPERALAAQGIARAAIDGADPSESILKFQQATDLTDQQLGTLIQNPTLASQAFSALGLGSGESGVLGTALDVLGKQKKDQSAFGRELGETAFSNTLDPLLSQQLFNAGQAGQDFTQTQADLLPLTKNASQAKNFGTSETSRLNRESREGIAARNRELKTKDLGLKERNLSLNRDKFEFEKKNPKASRRERTGKPSNIKSIQEELFFQDSSLFEEAFGQTPVPRSPEEMRRLVDKVRQAQREDKDVDLPLAVQKALEQEGKAGGEEAMFKRLDELLLEKDPSGKPKYTDEQVQEILNREGF